jgi:ankyrin repeat protein
MKSFTSRLCRSLIFRRTTVTLVALAWSSLAFCGEIHQAVMTGDLEQVRSLLKANPDLARSPGDSGLTPLHIAAMVDGPSAAAGGRVEFTSVLDKDTGKFKMVPVNAPGAGNIELDIAKALVEAGADVNAKFSSKELITPLFLAVSKGHDLVARFLLESKADPNAATLTKGWTPLHIVAKKGNKDLAELLLLNGANVNAKDKAGDTPLHDAAFNGYVALVDLLLENKADVNAKDRAGITPLHYAATMNKKDVATSLLEHHADVNAKTGKSLTPLHLAAGVGNKDMVELLVERKADVNAKDSDGNTPLHLALQNSHPDTAEFLRQHGGQE